MTDMTGRICVVTGATSGVGLFTARSLAISGAQLVLVGRTPTKGEAALTVIRAAAPRANVRFLYGDLSSLSDLRRLGAEINAAVPRLDVLVNNAGAVFLRREVTADGLERSFATNHMAYFLLTELLRAKLLASAPARIVSVASGAHKGATLDFDDLQSARDYGAMKVYGRSKLCNILWNRELARQLAGTGVTANCLHPGFVDSGIANNNLGAVGRTILSIVKRLTAVSPERGAETSVYLATSPEVGSISGEYFIKSTRAVRSPAAQDDAAARRLWQESLRLAGLGI